MSNEIVVVGSHAPALFIDVKRPPLAGETVLGTNFDEPRDGGKGSNQAIAASRLGASVSFVGRVGDDRLGNELKEWFSADSVDFSWLIQNSDYPTGAGFNIQTEDGDCALVTCMGANEFIPKDHIKSALTKMNDAKVMLTQFEIPIETALFAAKVSTDLGMKSIINPAPATLIDFSQYREQISILVPNEIEAYTLLDISPDLELSMRELCRQLKDCSGANCVIITFGKKGIVAMDDLGIWESTPPMMDAVDASGAGDEFCAALGVALVEGRDIRAASEWAANAAALSVTRQGTIPAFPYRGELEEFIRSNQNK